MYVSKDIGIRVRGACLIARSQVYACMCACMMSVFLYARMHVSAYTYRAAGVRLLSIHGPKHMSGNSENGTELCMFVELSSGVDMTRDLGPGSRYRYARTNQCTHDFVCACTRDSSRYEAWLTVQGG